MRKNPRQNIKCTSRIRAAEDDFAPEMPMEDVPMDDVPETAGGDVNVDDSAYGLLFETEDVAELVAEVTGQEVEVKADDESVVFTIGEDEYTVTPEEDTEVLESVRKSFRGRRRVSASAMAKARRPLARRPVGASAQLRRPMARRPMARRPVGASAQMSRPTARRPLVRRPVASATRPTAPIARRPDASRPMPTRRPVGASARPMPTCRPATAACKPTKAATAPVKQGKVIRKSPTTKK